MNRARSEREREKKTFEIRREVKAKLRAVKLATRHPPPRFSSDEKVKVALQYDKRTVIIVSCFLRWMLAADSASIFGAEFPHAKKVNFLIV